jgi:hypothetical protein
MADPVNERTSSRLRKRNRPVRKHTRDVVQETPDEVPSDFMSEADRNQGVARRDPFEGVNVSDDESDEAPKRRG